MEKVTPPASTSIKMAYYIFSPIQFEEMGYEFYQGKSFSIRYQLNKQFFWQTLFVPYGPNCQNKKGFEEFLQYLESYKLTKILIDLPLILNQGIKEEVISLLEQYNHKRTPYKINDEGTRLIRKGDFKPNKKTRYYIRQSLKNYNVEVVKNPAIKELQKIYTIYVDSSKRISFKPKKITAFQRIAKNGLLSVAYDQHGTPAGFAFGYIGAILDKEGIERKIMYVVYAGTNESGRKEGAGYGVYNELINQAFEEHAVEIIDLLGASNYIERPYNTFKAKFGKEFVELPGSFWKFRN